MEKWIILAFVLGLLVIFWRTRPRPRLPTPKVNPGFYDLFQARAAEVGREVFRSALRRLEHAETDHARVRRAAEELAQKLAELRASEGPRTERVADEWEYLGACYASRYPALYRLVESANLPGLERLAQAEPEALDESVSGELRALGRELDEGLASLAQDPAAIWGNLELVVLTLVVRESSPDEELAAALRAGRFAKRGPASQASRARRELAWNLVHSTPPAERRTHDGAPALVTEDPELGAAFVRFHVNEVAQKSELERARALVGGEVELLWLGQEIVGTLGYPEPSLDAWRSLGPLGRRVLTADDQARGELLADARARLGEAAEGRLGARLASEVGRFGMTPTVLLFDLDGTLVNAGGAGRRALAAAFVAVCQAPHAVDGVDLRGMTDSAIFRIALRAIGHPSDDGVLTRLADSYLTLLEDEIARAERYEVLPGVASLLEALTSRPHLAIGLGTGNLERGARIKLERGRLGHHFAFGGFGSDHEAREEILRIGAERGAARLGVPRTSCRVVVIGDTPRDVEAGLRIGGEVVGVGTGGYPPQELIELGATLAFQNLSAPGVAAVLGG